MTLNDRLAYCRRQIADHAMSDADWPVWLAEHDGLLVGAGHMTELECRDDYVTDERLKMWFRRGIEDSRVLNALEESEHQ